MLDASEPIRNTTPPAIPTAAGKSKDELCFDIAAGLRKRFPDIDPEVKLRGTRFAWELLESTGFAAPDDTDVMDVLAAAWKDPECRSWMQSQQEMWSKDRKADFAERLEGLAATSVGLPRLVSVADLDTTPPVWLWYPLVPRGSLTLVIGQPATGKTTMLAWLAARLSRGDALPNFSGHPSPVVRQEPQLVAWYDSESTGGALRRRLEAVGADLGMVRYASPDTATTLDAVDTIKADLAAMPRLPALVVFDTLGGFLTGKSSLESMSDMRRLLRPLAALADETGTAVVMLHHEGKGRRADLMHAGVGSIGIMGAARSALFCGKHPDSEGVYVMVHAKASEEATAQPVAYRLERHELENGASTVKVALDGVSNVNPLDVVNRPLPEDGERGALTEAVEWLEGYLDEGPELKADILKAAKREGISERTLKRAKATLGVESGKRQVEGVGWPKCPYEWYLAHHGPPSEDRENTSSKMVGHGGPNEGIQGVWQPIILADDTQVEEAPTMPETGSCAHKNRRLIVSGIREKWECIDCHSVKGGGHSRWRPGADPCYHENAVPIDPDHPESLRCLDCHGVFVPAAGRWYSDPNAKGEKMLEAATTRALQAARDAAIG